MVQKQPSLTQKARLFVSEIIWHMMVHDGFQSRVCLFLVTNKSNGKPFLFK
jgi:hypothetical protein